MHSLLEAVQTLDDESGTGDVCPNKPNTEKRWGKNNTQTEWMRGTNQNLTVALCVWKVFFVLRSCSLFFVSTSRNHDNKRTIGRVV